MSLVLCFSVKTVKTMYIVAFGAPPVHAPFMQNASGGVVARGHWEAAAESSAREETGIHSSFDELQVDTHLREGSTGGQTVRMCCLAM